MKKLQKLNKRLSHHEQRKRRSKIADRLMTQEHRQTACRNRQSIITFNRPTYAFQTDIFASLAIFFASLVNSKRRKEGSWTSKSKYL